MRKVREKSEESKNREHFKRESEVNDVNQITFLPNKTLQFFPIFLRIKSKLFAMF